MLPTARGTEKKPPSAKKRYRKRGKVSRESKHSHYLSQDSTLAGACRESLMPGVGPSAATCALQHAVKVVSLAAEPALCCTLSKGQQEQRARVKTCHFQTGVDGTPGTSFHRRKLRTVEILAVVFNLLSWIRTCCGPLYR